MTPQKDTNTGQMTSRRPLNVYGYAIAVLSSTVMVTALLAYGAFMTVENSNIYRQSTPRNQAK